MNEEKLITLLQEYFPSKKDLQTELSIVKTDISELRSEMQNEIGKVRSELGNGIGTVRSEIFELRHEVNGRFSQVLESIEDIKPSTRTLDTILEQYPIERIDRLEKHTGLPPYVPVLVEE